MDKKTSKVAVLWTGGKDCALALHEAVLAGYKISCLITFVPKKQNFIAHPVNFIKYQAQALELPHYLIEIKKPFKKSYEKAIFYLRKKLKIDTLVTGDIDEVDGHPNWIKTCSRRSGVKVLTPLWKKNRLGILKKLILYKFNAVFSCIKKPWFTMGWLGKSIDGDSLKKLHSLSKRKKFDACGENGEYHSLVLDCPLFQKSIHLGRCTKERENSMMYLKIKEVFLK